MKIIALFINFKRLSLKQTKRLLEGESPTLKSPKSSTVFLLLNTFFQKIVQVIDVVEPS